MIYAVQDNDKYILKFRYDPDLIYHIKNVPGRRWNPDEKFWTIPSNHLGMLINEIKGTVYETDLFVQSNEDINKNASIDSTKNIPDIDISDMDIYVKSGSNLYNHQYDFLKYAKSRAGRGFILADEMGCGKTLEVMNYALYMRKTHGYRHCLVICCVNSAKFSWQEDIFNHTNGIEQAYILGTRHKQNGGYRYNTDSKCKIEDLMTGHMYGDETAPELPYFIITNIESLRTKTGRQYTLAEEIIKMAETGDLQMIAIDEVHKNMSPKSIQGKLILNIKKQTEDKIEWIPMTGTPIINRPTDVFTPLKLVNGHSVESYWEWCQEFCVYGGYGDHEIIAYKNIPALKNMLQDNMIRRKKSEVLDLPPKIYYTEYVENTPYQQKLYTEIEREVWENREDILNSFNPLSKMLRLRQANGTPELVDDKITIDDNYIKKNAKIARLIELLDEITERGEKAVVFSNWVTALNTVYRFVSEKYLTVCYTGAMSEEARTENKKKFLNDPECKILLGTIGALGTNHTLTVANNVIFYDEPWTPADKVQAEDRCHRISAECPVNIYTILSKDTVDETVHKILYDKEYISNFIVDGNLDLRKNPELFSKLLGR